ncbi:MAG: PEP-CTERM sorting domain-containing protein [Pseudomonadota bacterium]
MLNFLPRRLVPLAGAVLAAVLTLPAAGPEAATVFVFDNGPDNRSQIERMLDGRTLIVDGFDESFNTATGTGGTGNINQGNNGLGISGQPESGRLAGGEALRLTFDRDVRLNSLLIHESGRENESFQLFGANNQLLSSFVVSGAGRGRGDLFDGLGLVGSTFTLVGTDPDGADNRGIRLSAVTVSAVPLPGALGLALGGLAVLGGFAWRRRALGLTRA